MSRRGFFFSFLLVSLGLTACSTPLLQRRIEIGEAVSREDCEHADALMEVYARSGALPGEIAKVCTHVNAMCASYAYERRNLNEAAARATRALDCDPGDSLARSILAWVEDSRREQTALSYRTSQTPSGVNPRSPRVSEREAPPPTPESAGLAKEPENRMTSSPGGRSLSAVPFPTLPEPPPGEHSSPSHAGNPEEYPAGGKEPAAPVRQEQPTIVEEVPLPVEPKVQTNLPDDQLAKIFQQRHEELPDPFPLPNEGGGEPELSIENDSSYQLIVIFKGEKFSDRVTLPPHESRTIKLPPGIYKVAAQINSPNVLLFGGQHSYQEGTVYSLRFGVIEGPENIG